MKPRWQQRPVAPKRFQSTKLVFSAEFCVSEKRNVLLVSLLLLPTQSGVCGCERGYTEVMTTHGFLDYCTRTPGVDSSKKADVKTNSGRSKPRPSQGQNLFSEWTLRPLGPGTEMVFTDWRQRVWDHSWLSVSCCFLFWVFGSLILLRGSVDLSGFIPVVEPCWVFTAQ